jgi:hypothetical protein
MMQAFGSPTRLSAPYICDALQLLRTWRVAWSATDGSSKLSVAENGPVAAAITSAWFGAAMLAAGIAAQLGTNVAPKRKPEMATTTALLVIFIWNSFFPDHFRLWWLTSIATDWGLLELEIFRSDPDSLIQQLPIRQSKKQSYSRYFENSSMFWIRELLSLSQQEIDCRKRR